MMRNQKNIESLIILIILILAVIVVIGCFTHSLFPILGNRLTRPESVEAHVGPADIYPDPTRTPGAANPDITQDNIRETICNPRWSTKSIRPAASPTRIIG